MSEESKGTRIQKYILIALVGFAVLCGAASFLTTEPATGNTQSQSQSGSMF